MKLSLDHRSAPGLFLIVALAAVFCALSFRATQVVGTDLFHPSLWGEDGAVFINEANELGALSLARPYAGYVHLIPRLAAYATSFMPLAYAPLLFHLTWLSVFLAFVCIAHSRLAAIGVPAVLHIWALVLLVVQPQAGEVFYTLTNIQWFTGLALMVYLIFPFARRVQVWQIPLICLAGLTGPFSILAIPVLALRTVVFRDLKTNWPVYLTVLTCAAIQAGFVFSSRNVFGAQASAASAGAWLSALFRFLTFGNEYPLATVFAFVFWASMPWRRIVRAMLDRFSATSVQERDIAGMCAFMMIVVAFGMMAVGFLRDDPSSMGPVIPSNGVASGSRYYLIPYSLLILAAVVSTLRDYPRAVLVMGALSIICIANFVRPERDDFQWRAYSKLARAVPDLVIPIAPRVEGYPGWYVDAGNQYSSESPVSEVVIPLDDVAIENGRIRRANGTTVLRAASENFMITFPIGRCSQSRTIGLEIEGYRTSGGWVQVLWASLDNFREKDSVLRNYPPGTFKGYFAFDRKVDQDTVGIRPGFGAGIIEVSGIRMFCLM